MKRQSDILTNRDKYGRFIKGHQFWLGKNHPKPWLEGGIQRKPKRN